MNGRNVPIGKRAFDLSLQRQRERRRFVPSAVLLLIVPAILLAGVAEIFLGGYWTSRPDSRIAYEAVIVLAALLTLGVAVIDSMVFRIPDSITVDLEGMTWMYGTARARRILWSDPRMKFTVIDVRMRPTLSQSLVDANEAGSISLGIGNIAYVSGECLDYFLQAAKSGGRSLEERILNQGTRTVTRRVVLNPPGSR